MGKINNTTPFAWQNKIYLRKIKKEIDRKKRSSVITTYTTLSRLSSDKNSLEFEVYIFDIANYSGLSDRTVSKTIKILEDLGIIKITPQSRLPDGKYSKIMIKLLDRNSVTNSKKTDWKNEENSIQDNGKIDTENSNIKDTYLDTTLDTNIDENIYINSLESKKNGKLGQKNNEKPNIEDISLRILKHRNGAKLDEPEFLSEDVKISINSRIKEYDLETIIKSMDNYILILKNDKTYFNKKRRLAEFLEKWMYNFINKGLEDYKTNDYKTRKDKPSNFLNNDRSKSLTEWLPIKRIIV